jgi:glyoxylase I family protein
MSQSSLSYSVPWEVAGLDHVVLRMRNRADMLHFYTSLLGCPVERTIAAIGMVQLRAGRALIDLIDADVSDPPGQNVDHLCLLLVASSLEVVVDHLREKGVSVGEPKIRYGSTGFAPSIYLCDPDGNGLELRLDPDTTA